MDFNVGVIKFGFCWLLELLILVKVGSAQRGNVDDARIDELDVYYVLLYAQQIPTSQPRTSRTIWFKGNMLNL